MASVTFEEVVCRKLQDGDRAYRLVLVSDTTRPAEFKSPYRHGIDVVAWANPFDSSIFLNSSEPPRHLLLDLRRKTWKDLHGHHVCSYWLNLDRDCRSEIFLLRASRSSVDSPPEIHATITVTGLSPESTPQFDRRPDVIDRVHDTSLLPPLPGVPVDSRTGGHVPDDAIALVETADHASTNDTNRPSPSPDSSQPSRVRSFSPPAHTLPPISSLEDKSINELLPEAQKAYRDASKKQSEVHAKPLPLSDAVANVPASGSQDVGDSMWSGIERIGALVGLVDVASDIYPLAKGVWSLLKIAYTLAKQRADLDEKIVKLVAALDANCTLANVLVRNATQIPREVESILKKILQEVLNGATLIQKYCDKRKSKLSVFTFAASPLASQVDACLEVLDTFRRNFSDLAIIDIQTLASAVHHDLKRLDVKFNRVVNFVQTQEEEALLNQMPFAYEADRALRSRERGCLPKTRVEIIDAIVNWAISAELDTSQPQIAGLGPNSRILWLCGVAGSGKSSIAISVAKALRSMDRLGALYGFERALQGKLNTTNLFSTIARQRADRRPHQKRLLLQTLEQMQPEMRATTDASEQFARFITSTSLGGAQTSDDVVVIDAFDEAGDLPARRSTILALSHSISEPDHLSGLRLIITSRYEPDVADSLEGLPVSDQHLVSVLRMQDIEPLQTERDIRLYVYHMLENMAGLEASQAAGELAQLAISAEHSFQWASTACFYVSQYDNDALRTPATRLEEVLNTRGGLHSLYRSILDQHFEASIKSHSPGVRPLRVVLGSLVCAFEPLSLHVIVALGTTDVPGSDIASYRLIARRLSSVVTGTHDEHAPLIPLHTSFTDFLCDAEHSGGYAVASHDMHLVLGLACLTVMKCLLRFNICSLGTSFLRNDDVPDLRKRIKQHIPDELSYACRFWPAHVARALSSVSPETEPLRRSMSDFLENKMLILQWLEVMSLTGTGALEALNPIVFLRTANHSLSDLITFTTYFAIPISTSVPHIYLSALACAPSSSLISSVRPLFPKLARSDFPLTSWPQVQHAFSHQQTVQCIAFSPDSQRVVSGEYSGKISIWDVKTGRLVMSRMLSQSPIYSVAFSPDGTILASGSGDNTIQLWDMLAFSAVGAPLSGHTDWVRSVAFSPDGKLLASGSDDATVRLWDVQSRSQVGDPFEAHADYVRSVAFSPDGMLLASGSVDLTIRLWDMRARLAGGSPLRGRSSKIYSVAFSPNGSLLASGSDDRSVCLWDVGNRSVVGAPLTGHGGVVHSVAFAPDGNTLASCSNDWTVRVWDLSPRSVVAEPLHGHTGNVLSLAFSADGALLASGSSDRTVHVWNASVSGLDRGSHTPQLKIRSFGPLSPDGSLLASRSDSHSIQIWDVRSVSPVGEPLRGDRWSIKSVAFSSDGTLMASGSGDRTVRLWDVRTGLAVGEPLIGHSRRVLFVAFSPDGRLLASSSGDETIRLWDVRTQCIAGPPLRGHCGWVRTVAFSADGRLLASGSDDKTVRIWNVSTHSLIGKPLEGHGAFIQSLAFSPDSTLVASGSDDKTIRLWNVRTQHVVGEPLTGHSGTVSLLAFSLDGKLLASRSHNENIIRIWDVATQSAFGAPLAGHTSRVTWIAFSPGFGDRRLVSSAEDGTVRQWDLRGMSSATNFRTVKDDKSRPNDRRYEPVSPTASDPVSQLSPDSFVRLEDGWILGPNKELVMWIPPALRPAMPNAYEVARFGGPPVNRLDFSKFVCGPQWMDCFDPNRTSNAYA